MDASAPADKYYFNTRTRQVEQGPRSMAKDRLGPYDTYAEAANALEQARRRSESWDEDDEEFKSWGSSENAGSAENDES